MHLKKVFSILMVAAILLPNLTKIGIFIDFKINQDFIAEFLCINKEEPIVMCYGECYLSDQLQKAEDQENQQRPTAQKERLEVIYCYSNILSQIPILLTQMSKLNAGDEDSYSPPFIKDVFHPPQV